MEDKTKSYRELGWKLIMLKSLRRSSIWKLNPDMQLHMGQLPVLECIINNKGCAQRDLCEWLKVSAPTITNSCRRLEDSGLIVREVDSENRRSNRLYPTPDGEALAAKCRAGFDTTDALTFDALTPQEQETFAALMDKMIAALQKETSEDDLCAPCMHHHGGHHGGGRHDGGRSR